MITSEQIMLFSLIFMRMTGCILFNGFFGRKNIPAMAKAGFILVLSFLVYSSSAGFIILDIRTPVVYGVYLIKEFAIGYVMGYVMSLVMYIIIFAGEFIDLQMGLSMSKIFDPQSNSSLSLTASLLNVLFALLFFSMNGHLAVLHLILTTGEIIPYGHVALSANLGPVILKFFSECTVLAVKLAFPIFAAEFLLEIGVGILMKAIPQINVFVVNIQMKILLGFLILLLIFSPVGEFLQDLIVLMIDALKNSLMLLR